MEKDSVRECLLADEDSLSRQLETLYRSKPSRNLLSRYRGMLAMFGVLLLSLALNIFQSLRGRKLANMPDTGRSYYSGLGYDTPTVYRASTDYWGDNETLADELWNAVDTDPIVVALSDDYVKEHGLKKSGRFPWDDEKGIYFLKAFHDLHCLVNHPHNGCTTNGALMSMKKLMRKAFVDYQRGNVQTMAAEHIHHCLDGLRQDIMCRADDTPMPSSKIPHHVGDGQVVQCRDWNKLIAWTREPERNACHKMLDDYRSITHSLERHAFCPEGSPYYSAMKAYFKKHGHKDPWE